MGVHDESLSVHSVFPSKKVNYSETQYFTENENIKHNKIFRKEDSTLFPSNLQITVGNLLSFVLANLDEESHMEALINICAVGADGSAESCLARARWLCLDILEDHLRDFRRLRRFRTDEANTKRLLDTRRRVLLLRLELVREVHLLLGTSSDLVKEKVKVCSDYYFIVR